MPRPWLPCLLLVAAVASAQPRPPSFLSDPAPTPRLETPHLQAQADGPARVGPDGRAVITIVVTPKAKMHVYAADVEGYVPLTMTVEPASWLVAGKATYPSAETYVFPPTGETSRAYITPFRVTQAFALTAAARRTLATRGSLTGVASLRYQACDDTVCYRPTTGSLAFDITRERRLPTPRRRRVSGSRGGAGARTR